MFHAWGATSISYQCGAANTTKTNRNAFETQKTLALWTILQVSRCYQPLLPILCHFSIIHVHPCSDIFSITNFEPMHNLSPGFSQIWMHCMIAMLKDEERIAENISLRSGLQTFWFNRRKVLRAINNQVQNITESSKGYELHVDFSDGKVIGRIYGFFLAMTQHWESFKRPTTRMSIR